MYALAWRARRPLQRSRVRRRPLPSLFARALLGKLALRPGWIYNRAVVSAFVAVQQLLVFNHPSWVDSILLLAFFAPSGVSRESNLKIPIVGRIIRSFQNIYTHAKPAPQEAAGGVAAPLVARTTTQQISQRCAPTCALTSAEVPPLPRPPRRYCASCTRRTRFGQGSAPRWFRAHLPVVEAHTDTGAQTLAQQRARAGSQQHSSPLPHTVSCAAGEKLARASVRRVDGSMHSQPPVAVERRQLLPPLLVGVQ